jgi:hypothetical protein
MNGQMACLRTTGQRQVSGMNIGQITGDLTQAPARANGQIRWPADQALNLKTQGPGRSAARPPHPRTP